MNDHLRRPKKKTELPLTTTTTKPKPTLASRRDALKDLNHWAGRTTTTRHPHRSSASGALIPNPPKSQLLHKQMQHHPKTPLSAPPLPRTALLHSSSSSSSSPSSPSSSSSTKNNNNNNKNPPNPRYRHSQPTRPCHPSISRARPPHITTRSDLPNPKNHRPCSTKTTHLQSCSRESPALPLQSTPEKEQGDSSKQQQQHRNKTPPIYSSISPEIPSAPLPTSACFAAGHLLAGVRDRRKCRPRGILKVRDGDGDSCKEVRISYGPSSTSDLSNSDPDGSTRSPHLPRASMQWLSSPRENSDSSDDGWRTPSSNSSISPFSMILKKAAASSGNGAFAFATTDAMPTPSSRSSFLSTPEGEGVAEAAERRSFQFGCAAVSAESVDLDTFRRSPRPADAAIKRLSGSGSRTSWEEGLVSRTFELREFVDDGDGRKDVVDGEGELGSGTNDHSGGNGFGSIEYVPKPQSDDHRKGDEAATLEVARFVELVSIDSDLFLPSGDSDWRVSFGKHSFES